MSINPKDHPTFKRAMNIAHRKLMEQKDTLNSRIDALLKERILDQQEAASVALAELAQQAYDDAVKTLDLECARRARIEYTVPGELFLEDAKRQMSARPEEASKLLLGALMDASGCMPDMIRTIHEFGIREDGLIFGSTRNDAMGGSFEPLHERIIEALDDAALAEAKRKILSDGGSEDLAETMAPKLLSGMRPVLRKIAARSFPCDDPDRQGRALCTHADDLQARLERLAVVTFSADNEPRHAITGSQASARLAKLALEADQERPGAASISRFFLQLGH